MNKVYSTDVAYLITKTNRYYLFVIKDLCIKKIAVHNISDKHDIDLIIWTLNILKMNQITKNVIL